MSSFEGDLDAIYRHIDEQLMFMKERKSEIHLKEFKIELNSSYPDDLLENKTYHDFLEIAWEFCDNKDKNLVRIKLDEFYNLESARRNKAVLLKEVLVLYTFLRKEAEEKFLEDGRCLNALANIAFKRTSSAISTSHQPISYELVPSERKFDVFGSWKLDKLFGLMRIILVVPNPKDSKTYQAFPEIWRTDKKVTKLEIQTIKPDDPLFNTSRGPPSNLREFLKRELKIENAEQLNDLLASFKSRHIVSVAELLKINDLDEFKRLMPAHHELLNEAVQRHKRPDSDRENDEDKRTLGELLGDWHKVKRFLFYEAGMKNELSELGKLNREALKKGFEEQKACTKFDGGPVLEKIFQTLQYFTGPEESEESMIKNSQGLLLYGPPGTGKTELCKVIISKAGLFGLVSPLASSELNRSLVGETEKVITAIFQRAYFVPHLLCCIAIDEIDALAPIRNQKSAEHKVDVLSLILSLLGGIKNVPNVFLIASTNRLNRIDEAFARRLEDKFHVGRLSPDQGFELLKKISNSINLNSPLNRLFTSPEEINKFKHLITNFSGAAIASLRSKLLKYCELHKVNNANISQALVELSTIVANAYQIKFGGYCIPNVIQKIKLDPIIQRLRTCLKDSLDKFTGRILIDLRSKYLNIQFEMKNDSLKEFELLNLLPEIYIPLNSKIKFTSDLIPFLIAFAFYLETAWFQLIDVNMMLSSSAFDQSSCFEVIIERLTEFKEYENSMLIFDVDTLVGISENMSDSIMSESLSYSIQNSEIWQKIVLQTFMSIEPGKTYKNHRWCIMISSSEFLINQFKKLAKFDFCKTEKDLRQERTCVNCGKKYTNLNNGNISCSYHAAKLLTKSQKANDKAIQNIKIEFSADDIRKRAKQQGNRSIFDDYYYTCCMGQIDSDGCISDFHMEVNQKKDKLVKN